MALTITDRAMRSVDTRHTATHGPDGWRVSWLPERCLDQYQATAAMRIAELAGQGIDLSDDPGWPAIDAWAAALGLSGPRAVVLASESPEAGQ